MINRTRPARLGGWAFAAILALLVTTAPAATATPDGADERGLPALAARSLVTVHYTLGRDSSDDNDAYASFQDESPWQEPAPPTDEELLRPYIDGGMTLDTVGVVIAPGEVFVADPRIRPALIKDVNVRTLDGAALPARRGWMLTACDALVLKVDDPKGLLKPVRFHAAGPVKATTRLRTTTLSRVERDWCVATAPLSASLVRPGVEPWVLFGRLNFDSYAAYGATGTTGTDVPAARLLIDAKNRPIGVTAAAGVDSVERYGAWLGASVLASPRIDLQTIDRRKDELRSRLLRTVHEITVRFRGGDEAVYYGVAVGERRLFVPGRLDRKSAAQIEAITVRPDAKRRLEARFAGAYADFGGFLVELTDRRLPAVAEWADAAPKRGEPFWAAIPTRKHAHTHLLLDYARLTHTERGRRNRYHWRADCELAEGDLLFDRDGRLFAVVMEPGDADGEPRRLAAGYEETGFDELEPTRIFTVDELADALARPKSFLDTDVVVKGRLEARRRPWLGVEYVTLTPEIAEQMNVARPTHDGAVGLLVNTVYPASPAARAGVAEGDILLSITPAGKTEPLELVDHDARRRRGGWRPWPAGRQGPALSAMNRPSQRTWKSRDNYLTNLLDAVGVGSQVKLRYCRLDAHGDPIEREATVTVELSPPDNAAARRWRNRRLGLAVRDLTYEVRQALTLPADAPGVVIASVESGSPASTARLWPNEIITHANGKPLAAAKTLRDIIAAAKAAGRPTVRLAVLRLGKSRFADLHVASYSPADDEDLDQR